MSLAREAVQEFIAEMIKEAALDEAWVEQGRRAFTRAPNSPSLAHTAGWPGDLASKIFTPASLPYDKKSSWEHGWNEARRAKCKA